MEQVQSSIWFKYMQNGLYILIFLASTLLTFKKVLSLFSRLLNLSKNFEILTVFILVLTFLLLYRPNSVQKLQ
jgi:Kef-type K+ transport system membrane component KefB